MTLDNQVFVRRFVSFHVVLGVVVMGLAVYSYATRPRCPAYCAQHVAPWFASTCGCIYVNVDCAKLNISGSTSDMEGMLTADTIGSSVFWVQIANCDVANGLSPRTMQQLPALYGISLWQTHLSDWTMPETVWPAQLTKISLQHSPHLTEVPQVLSPLPSSVQVLFLVGCGITELSNSTVQSWRRLRQLWISQLPITTLPPSIATLEMLDGLRLNNNRLVSFSVDTIRTMATLEVLSLSSNNLTLLPWGKRAIETDVADNPIATLPRELSVDFLATGVVTVASTVFCAVQLKQNPTKWATICHPLCAPHCSSQLVGNGLCDVSCLVPQCDYDGGDCNEFFAPGDGQ
ncbi:hypothetical protein DYB32_002764 [Aphanomyces invadans]|uniref:LNR domain-containing protein n=1 Tax=Aphanomyces invadans TaxID=157072 RepID=A0A3R6VQ01_9STRA|nr:hypothetical protein DYB32_002764 [Aphanomyces invadans]